MRFQMQQKGCKEYDPDLDPQIASFKRLRPSIQQGILERFLDLALNPEPSWVKKPNGCSENIREFIYDNEAVLDKPLAIRYGIDLANCELHICEISESERIPTERREIRFFSLNKNRVELTDFLKKAQETGGKEIIGDLFSLFLKEENLGYPQTERLGDGLHQLRANLGNVRYRIFYGYENSENEKGISVVLNGMVKSKKEDQQLEIDQARKLLKIAHKDLLGNSVEWEKAKSLLQEFLE